MSDGLRVFGLAWLPTQLASLVMLYLGARWAGHRHLLSLGELAHRQKLRALKRTWPLTLLRPAVDRADTATCALILSSLIVLKSVACFIFGIAVVFWLPIASLVVPAIVAVHDPSDPTLAPWVRRVATLQVTSHSLAAAMGFAIVVVGPVDGTLITVALADNVPLLLSGSAASFAFAVAAGRLEAAGVVQRGI